MAVEIVVSTMGMVATTAETEMTIVEMLATPLW